MPTYIREQSLDERVAVLEQGLAQTQRGAALVDDIALFRVGFENYNYDDASSLSTVFETYFTPRGALLTLGMSFFGDQVGTSPVVSTGGAWDVLLNGTVAASGLVPNTFTIVGAMPVLDLSPYLGTRDLHVEVRPRRTSGATAGGRYGGGGCIASTIHFARIS